MLPSTFERVRLNTAEEINQRIRRQTEDNIRRIAALGQEAITRRIGELEQEWDIERYVETMAPSLTLAGLALGLTVNRKWFAIPILVQAFFLQHATQGWCPPIPVLRRMGIRTTAEIDEERNALKALRGDYWGIKAHNGKGAVRAYEAACRRGKLN